MDKQQIISAIVPVYNTKNELERCVDSLLKQTYSEIEIILVDDGSSDGSEQICDKYAEQDDRVKVIHQRNAGVVAARKAGVRAARGEYLSFVDSDDYVDADMYQTLTEVVCQTQADMISFGFIREYAARENGTVPGAPEYDCLEENLYDIRNRKFFYENFICCGSYARVGISASLCSKLLRKNLVVKNMDRVSEKITWGEDACLTYICCMDAEKVFVLHKAPYHYCMREASCVHGYDRKCFGELNERYECLYKKIVELTEYQNILFEQLYKHVAKEVLFCLKNRFGFPNGGMLPLYTVTLSNMPPDTRLVLYGAGKVGTSYYKQITGMGQANIVLWVDKDPEQVKKNAAVNPVEDLLSVPYDYVLIAVKQKSVAEVIKKDLINMGIDEEKIIWEEPKHILDIYN